MNPERAVWKYVTPFVTHRGQLCGLCDSMHGCEHPRVKCLACGTEGLKENWPFPCCNVTDAIRNRKTNIIDYPSAGQ